MGKEKYNKFALLTDLYELTMMQGYYFTRPDSRVVFDLFFREQPFKGGYSIFSGLKPAVEKILNLAFTEEDIEYLRSQNLFKEEFLDYLSNFKFTGDIYALNEGTAVFPGEPVIRIHGNIIETQLIESLLLNIINFQTLIATKSARVREAARGRAVLEFGLRRAQGIDGALSASRAAYIGGASASSNTLAGKIFDIPIKGTMAHSWVQSFGSEEEAFRKFSELYPESAILLVDTYDTLNRGIPSAVKVLKEKKQVIKKSGIRLDSGDLEYLSKKARKKLDQAGLKETKIVVSNELDEYIIEELLNNEAPIDFFGVGTKMVTAQDSPSLTGVYKLAAKTDGGGTYKPSMKLSDNPSKRSNPGIKNIMRFYKEDGDMADLIFLEDERDDIEKKIKKEEAVQFFHPTLNNQSLVMNNYKKTGILLENIVKKGRLNKNFSSLNEMRKRTLVSLETLHPTYKRLLNPHRYKVSLTNRLKNLKQKIINGKKI